jgi:hypothetical protein
MCIHHRPTGILAVRQFATVEILLRPSLCRILTRELRSQDRRLQAMDLGPEWQPQAPDLYRLARARPI